jgi:hypothetical protein
MVAAGATTAAGTAIAAVGAWIAAASGSACACMPRVPQTAITTIPMPAICSL